MHWSGEYGPHLMVPGNRTNPQEDLAFTWSTARHENFDLAPQQAEEFVLATSEKVKTSFLLTVPLEEERLFTHHMRHNGRSIGWDRAGWGSAGLVMENGYDGTWACMIQMGTSAGGVAPTMTTTVAEAMPIATQYRDPPRLKKFMARGFGDGRSR